MKKWEKKYNVIKSAEFEKRLDELQLKFDSKSITREELKELESSKRKKENVQKVDNVLEYKSKLEEQLTKVKAEEARRRKLSMTSKEMKRLQHELEGLKSRQEFVQKIIGKGNLPEQEKQDYREELIGLNEKINKNQDLYSKTYKDREEIEGSSEKLALLSDEELQGKIIDVSSKISKCNMICGRLVEGYSWDSIDVKLENWQEREFRGEKGTLAKMQRASEPVRESALSQLSTELGKAPAGRVEEHTNSTEMVEISDFDLDHPRIARIKNLFKNAARRVKDFFRRDNAIDADFVEEIEEEVKEVVKETPNIDDNKEFRDYIKVVAEKGMEAANREKLEARRRELQNRETDKCEKPTDSDREL